MLTFVYLEIFEIDRVSIKGCEHEEIPFSNHSNLEFNFNKHVFDRSKKLDRFYNTRKIIKRSKRGGWWNLYLLSLLQHVADDLLAAVQDDEGGLTEVDLFQDLWTWFIGDKCCLNSISNQEYHWKHRFFSNVLVFLQAQKLFLHNNIVLTSL